MATTIIRHNGVYNAYSSISDAFVWSSGMTREELYNAELARRLDYTKQNIARVLTAEFSIAEIYGSSGGDSAEVAVSCNRCGDDEECLPFDEIVERYLTARKEF